MREEELRAYRNKAIEKDRRSIENRLNHAFNQGYEMGRQMARDIPVELQCVLDKIRSEIETLPKTYPFVNHCDMYVKEDDVRKIIDKYRKSEG